MKIYPAIDLYDGEAVRLEQGDKTKMRSYGDPMRYAEKFSDHVGKIHMVDLEGAFDGEPRNLDVVEKIIDSYDIEVQIGGGFRELSSVKRAYSAGVENVIIGTRAFDEDFMSGLTERFEGIMVSLDIKSGNLAVEGWRTTLDMDLDEGLDRLNSHVDRLIYTMTEKDGLLEGIEELPLVPEGKEAIYAGGIASKDDIDYLDEVGFDGCIIGRALYEDEIDLAELKEGLSDAG